MSAHDRGSQPRADRDLMPGASGGAGPRLVVTGSRGVAGGAVRIRSEEVERLAELLLRTQERPSLDFVREVAESGHGLTTLVVELLAPATRVVGAAWADDRVGFLEAGIAYGRVQQMLRRLSQEFDGGPLEAQRAGRVLLMVPEGETHTLGLFSLAELLMREHWEVVLGRPVLDASPATLVHMEWFDAVLVSAAQEKLLPAVTHEITRLRRRSRNPDLTVMLGGNLTVLVPDAGARCGANSAGGEADSVSNRLTRLLAGAAS